MTADAEKKETGPLGEGTEPVSGVEAALLSVLTPGVHPAMYLVVNACLLVVLFLLVALYLVNKHAWVHFLTMGVLACGLAASINWFLAISTTTGDGDAAADSKPANQKNQKRGKQGKAKMG
jgi:hypothetical protein